uniref:Ig-like domain-containing protein n=1 Tax=Fundulus heteroclitus TaxID=8078 RepID=A0A3Q2U9Z8_FUNHE
MIRNFTGIILLLLWLPGSSNVHQEPPSIIGSPEGPATISCSHSVNTYDTILWYQKLTGDSALKLIGYNLISGAKLEDEFKDHFSMKGDGSKKSELSVQKLQPEDSGTYYCAASKHSDSVDVSLLQKPSLMNQLINIHGGGAQFVPLCFQEGEFKTIVMMDSFVNVKIILMLMFGYFLWEKLVSIKVQFQMYGVPMSTVVDT